MLITQYQDARDMSWGPPVLGAQSLRYYLTDTGEIWQKIHDFLIFSEEMDQFMYS